ncbi:sterol desaturase family protein [Parachitinimonas caeni]|uniref:Sterol desaturase family protein n=1 Tax=Parachitinimonas caeni TaxID=3031301 RepID=A0ABT7DW58_9NEIS|nr:sterol desaturase family protein [Parachitinimonas caeni]MDK2124293.1 sterol desaturase family protein [Parachitinimonas caeni]
MDQHNPLFFIVFPVLLLLAAAEAVYLISVRRHRYDWSGSFASFGVAIGHHGVALLTIGLTTWTFGWVWQHRLLTLPLDRWWSFPLVFLLVEFFYYWAHRISHESRWFWASHAVHHTPQRLYLSGAYRLAWTGSIAGGAVFFLPVVWLGVSPKAVLLALTLNLLYQFWLHTELIPRLGWFDRIFNSPSNHRVHHAINPRYLDSNYGGVLIVFDHLFGTYVAERDDDPCRYGLVTQLNSHNPLRIVFHEWQALCRDVWHSRSLRQMGFHLFGAPGWSADGSRRTSAQIRSEAGFLPGRRR